MTVSRAGDGLQPRGAFSYLFKPTKTVIRGGYSHTIETPTNENLVASSSTGSGGLASNLFKGTAEQRPIALGSRNQYDAGIQQGLGRWVLVDVSYFRKYTRNAFDFDALFSTPITFPIGWRQSKLDGVSARVSTIDIHGLRVYATMGHANARFFGPGERRHHFQFESDDWRLPSGSRSGLSTKRELALSENQEWMVDRLYLALR